MTISREAVLRGVDKMAGELLNHLPLDVALERARNIAQALQDGRKDPLEVVQGAMSGHLEDLDFGPRVLVLARVAGAWTSAVQTEVFRTTEPTPIQGFEVVERRLVPTRTFTMEELEAARIPLDREALRAAQLRAAYPNTKWATNIEEEMELIEDEPRDDCSRCGGSGGGPDRALKCPACGGSGRSRESVQREEDARAEYLADYGIDDADIPW